ncbi:hypothetical protein [Garciella nitratireducens]|nr:hypothetical protein [Garciella nitratireducens]
MVHVTKAVQTAGTILNTFGYSEREMKLVKIAAYICRICNWKS